MATFVKLTKAKRKLEEQLKDNASALAEVEEAVKTWLADQGIASAVIDGYTVYLQRQLFAQRSENVTTEELCAALTDAGLNDFVKPTVNMNTLSAWARELDSADVEIPPQLTGVLKTAEVFRVRARRKV